MISGSGIMREMQYELVQSMLASLMRLLPPGGEEYNRALYGTEEDLEELYRKYQIQ